MSCTTSAQGKQAVDTGNHQNRHDGSFFALAEALAVAMLLSLGPVTALPATAQVSPAVTSDSSLSTTVTGLTDGTAAINFVVTDGQRYGNNLFHSFEQLSVPRGGSVRFNHDADIATIFSRVTGNSASQIEGRLITQDSADLYLLNPNGIIFGPEAQLQLGGSFVGTTAQAITFADGTRFGVPAFSPVVPLLTLSQPIGFDLGPTPAAIVNRAQAQTLQGRPLGLTVADGQILSFIGGDLLFESGHLTAPSGSIRLQGDRITLQNARITADNRSSLPSDGIQVQSQSLELGPGSLLSSLTLGDGAGGPIQIQAESSVTLTGSGYRTLQDTFVFGALQQQIRPTDRDRLTGMTTGTVSSGDSGRINITTPRLTLSNGAALWTPTFGPGQGGDIELQVSEQLWHEASAIATSAYALGSSGRLKIQTDQFIVSDSAFIDTSTFSPAAGGEIRIEATDLQLRSPRPDAVLPNAIFSASLGSSGIPGNVTILTDQLRAESGSQITSTGGARVRIIDIPTGGRSGNVSVTARESIELVGRAADGLPTQISTTNYANESAGQLKISTPQLRLKDGARLLALSEQGGGGNIVLEIGAIALLQGNSEIAATALSGSGNGGNIVLASPLLLLQQSAIRANAEGGLGGQVQIQATFVGQSESILSASSGLGQAFGGTVELSSLKNNPQNDRSTLPSVPIDDENAIAADCREYKENSAREQFIISGRSGLPDDPLRPLDGKTLWQDLRPAMNPALAPGNLIPQSTALEALIPALSQLPLEKLPLEKAHSERTHSDRTHSDRTHSDRTHSEAIAWRIDAQGNTQLLGQTPSLSSTSFPCWQLSA